jgi:hypothetical protein
MCRNRFRIISCNSDISKLVRDDYVRGDYVCDAFGLEVKAGLMAVLPQMPALI